MMSFNIVSDRGYTLATPPLLQDAPPAVMTLGCSDPSGGAGIQADILTLASLGCHPVSVITALTVQDSASVHDLMVIDADWVHDQARLLLEDMPIAAFKVGLIGSIENVAIIAQLAADYPDIPLNWTCPDCGARKEDFEMIEI